ncbi:DUF1705 domain-containing protein, partial [Vibrio cholerae]
MLWTLIIGVIPAIFIAKTSLTLGGSFFNLIIKKLISLLVSLCIISLIAIFYYQDYVSVGRNNSYLNKMIIPTHFIYSTVKYLNNNYFIT